MARFSPGKSSAGFRDSPCRGRFFEGIKMAKIETRFAEIRAEGEGRLLVGRILVYRDIATLPFGKEMFLPGAFSPVESLDVILNFSHKRSLPIARTQGGGLILEDTPQALSLRAELPQSSTGDDALSLVRAKVLRGLSVEFSVIQERMVSGCREISKAVLHAIGIVDSPAYKMSILEARAENVILSRWHTKLKKELLWL